MLSHVLKLSRGIGREVLGSDRRPVGRLADLSVRLDGDVHRVHRLLVHPRRGPALLVPWEAVAAVQSGQVLLRTADVEAFRVGSVAGALDPDEILLVRDVLDTQVVDVVGQRLARVAEVLLVRTRDSAREGAGLEVAGVEVGFAGVLRRLGLAAAAVGEDVVAWSDLHLTSERGHRVQLSTPRAAVHRLDPRALAALVSRVDTDAATEILASREPAVAADVVRVAHPEVGERVLRAMPAALAARIVAAMPGEHAGHWRDRLAHTPALLGRRFLRSGVWARRHLNWHPNGQR